MQLNLSYWIYVMYLILYELFVSTISFKPVKNYHTIAPSMYCCNFETLQWVRYVFSKVCNHHWGNNL